MFTKGTKTFLAIVAFSLTLTLNAFAAESRAEAEAPISRQRAQEIALQQVSGGRIIEAEFNDRWFRDDDYEFVVVDNMHRYTVSVDAKTGEVLDVKQERVFEDNISNSERARLNTNANAAAVGAVSAGSAVTRAANATRNAADSAIDSASSAARSAAASVDNAIDRAASATRNAAVSAENAAGRAVRSAATSVNNAANSAASATRSAAVNAGKAADSAANRAMNATNNAATGSKYAMGISKTAGGITPERARAIAMERVPSGSVVEMERNIDDDRAVYDIEMISTTKQIDLKVDAMTGGIVSYDEENLDLEDRIDNVRPIKATTDVR